MFAVIDLGSNSFHLLIADYINGHFSVIDRHSEKVQLAEKIFITGKLGDAAIQRGFECLKRFKQALTGYDIEKIAIVATQAMRQASNADQFIGLAKSIGMDINVIDGPREAELIYRGICDPLPDANCNRLVFDIGGASTEIALGNNENILLPSSTAIGCVSWRDQFFGDDFNYVAQAPTAKKAAQEALAPVVKQLKKMNWEEIYASSGTAKMFSNIATKNGLSSGELTPNTLASIEQMVLPYNNTEEINIFGLKTERKDLLAPGLCVMMTLMEMLEIQLVTYSHTSLREGVLREISEHRVNYNLNH